MNVWPVGHIYLRDEKHTDRINSSRIWYFDDAKKYRPFQQASEGTEFGWAEGLPGRVMASAKPEWITDAQNDPRFRRRAGKALKDNERALEDHVKTLSETQEALEEKGRQLAASRDHLELQVTMRTSELAEALKQEQEFNALQREFIGMASHEFRTPVTIIDGETRRIIKRAETMEPQQIVERGKRIRDQVKRINELIDSTLSLTRLDDGLVELKLENCDLQKLLAHICGVQVGHAPGKKIMFMGVDLPETIVADPQLLGQVFSNLLSNAVKTAS